MAIDDVMSDYDNQIANGAYLTVQPASGDEWLLTACLVEGDNWELSGHSDAGTIRIGLWGGSTGASVNWEFIGLNEVAFLLTNGEHIRILNNSGATKNGGFSAIKSKD